MTRGQDGLLFLSCTTLSFAALCRFIPAHQARPCPTFGRPVHLRGSPHRLQPGTSVGSRAGAAFRRFSLSVAPRFLWECLTNRTVNPFPVPASLNPAGGFPALGFPACFSSRVCSCLVPRRFLSPFDRLRRASPSCKHGRTIPRNANLAQPSPGRI